MSNKLQEIKSQFKWGKENLGTGIDNIEDRDVTYLILQLEQAQAENEHIKAAIDSIQLSDEPTQKELFEAYKEIYKGNPVGFFIEQIETNIKDMNDELEQAQQDLRVSKKCHDLAIEKNEYTTQKYKERCQEIDKLSKSKHKLQAVYDENYEKACVRAGEIERLNEQNQKLIEVAEYYADENRYFDSESNKYAEIHSDNGDKARDILKEVKG